nr:MAG TPA: L SHAPED TAIL FIBER PROTEIN [Caudoviricetes sp.]
MLQLRIMNQNISYYATSRIVADSQGYLYFTLETSEEWNEYVKVVQFTRDGKTYDVPDVRPGVQYQVPWEALVGGGTMFVSCYGMSGETNRATTNELEITVYDSGFYKGDPSTDPTPDKYQQFVDQVLDAKRDAETAAANAAESASEAEEYAKEVTNYADQVYKNTQLAEQAAQRAENAAGDAEIYFKSAQEYAKQAEDSAVAADESEMHASMSEINAKQSETNAKQSETNAAKSESNASLSASKAEANQIIVTETKAEIDEIYVDIQSRHDDITEKNNNVNEKAEQVNAQAQQVEDWYNKFLTGCEYVEFTDEISEDLWVADGDTYTIEIYTSGKAILNIQMKDEANNQYIRVPFVDMEFNTMTDKSVTLRAIYPFAGRLCIYDLVEGVTENV